MALALLGGGLVGGVVKAGDRAAGAPPLAAIPAGRFVMGGREAEPPQERREVEVPAFRMGLHEVTVREWVAWLNTPGAAGYPGSPQIVRRGDRFRPARGQARRPAAWVSLADAQAYCGWLSERTRLRVRLPTEAEWERAARGGLEGARYPWGWGAPEGRACFAAKEAREVGSYPPNPYGLRDMAGNVFEWCAPDPAGGAFARGGSWAENDPRFLRVYNRVSFPAGYRDADVGFRIVVEQDE
ncbi:MAG: SUMF1/EgtB/PvdO family nonheme iron enzyme [Kiritimatiellae bacterium]|nr:SUMF1/EgtB/PvdO family nonheme iron enzyme [Kiritimatiellia bacterium]